VVEVRTGSVDLFAADGVSDEYRGADMAPCDGSFVRFGFDVRCRRTRDIDMW
jgi:hypothetical protein